MKRKQFLSAIAAPLLFVLITSCATSTIYVVRHAEKAGPSGDVPLSGDGLQRAETLKDSLKSKRIVAVYCTGYKRTFQTANPTATYFGLDTTTYVNGDSLMQKLIVRKGKHSLVVGHSNTVPQMLRAVGLQPSFTGNIPDSEYDNLFEVRVSWGTRKQLRLIEKKYGL